MKIEICNIMSQVKFQKLIDDFSAASLAEILKSHDFFRVQQNPLPTFNDKQFTDFSQLGDFDLEDNVNIIVICSRSLTPLNERASRKTQYDLGKKILKNFPKARAGIFVYYDSKGGFRMSLIYADYVGTKVNYSTFRRFTYFVSKQQKNVTFLQQVASLKFTNFKELKELFSVEKVTKEFFKNYRDLFIEILEDFEDNNEFQNIVVKTGISTTPDFVKKLMGQIVFLYFVQKKGWLGVRPNENWGTGDQGYLRSLFETCRKTNQNYFDDYLEPLFYEALAEKRGEDDFFEQLNCRIPFLNGGLFESVYDWKNTEINIHNEVLGKLLDFFDQYNFTVDENTPSDQEISVDPEMLGKIFENLLEVKDRKDKGAFYTPREIVHYMCRESLIQHLVSEDTAPEDRIRKLFENKDTDLSILVDDYKKTEIIKRMQELKDIAEKVDVSLRNVKIVDPAVGSGAFPMGMLNEISSVRHYLNTNFLHKTNDTGKELSLYDIKKETLENCIYAVDLEPGAVEIAKLRFWLALIVEFESNDPKIAPPVLPNLDYKIMQGNSLLEEYEGVKLFDENIIKTIDTDKEKQIEDLKKKQSVLQKEYFRLNADNKLTPIKKVELDTEAKSIHDQLKKLTKTEKVNIEVSGLFDFDKHKESKFKADQLKLLQKHFFETNKKDKKESIKKEIEKLEWELIEATLIEQGKTSELSKIEGFKKSKIKPFFLWKLHFADVFEQKGGFDIVIGNPPYIRHRDLPKKFKDELCSNYDVGNTTADIYCYFYELGYNLLSEYGTLTYITSNKWMRSRYGDKLRLLLKNKTKIEVLIDLGGGQFETATVDTNIIIIRKGGQNGEHYLKYGQRIDDILYKMKQSDLGENSFALIDQSVANLKASIEARGLKLKDWTSIKINYGILTGRNDTKNSSGEKEGVFIVDEAKRNELIKNDKNSEVFIKPILRGKDVAKYSYDWQHKYLITTYYGTHKIIDKYPAIKKHLSHYKEILESRAQVIRGDHNWIELDQNPSERYLKEMEQNKIIYPNINKEFAAAYDDSGVLVNQKCFFIIGNNLKYLLGILNSKLNFFYFKLIGASLGNAGYDISKIFVNELPIIPAETNLEIKKAIEGLVNQVIDHKKQNKDNDTKKLEHQIDELVYKLYKLTPEEIEIIENSSKK